MQQGTPPLDIAPPPYEVRCRRCGYPAKVLHQTQYFVVVTEHGRLRCWLIRVVRFLAGRPW
jgi:hypothetical protein